MVNINEFEMKIVYLASRVTASGGVAKVLSEKLSALVDLYGYEIVVISTNDETTIPFYDFHPAIRFHFIDGTFKKGSDVWRFYGKVRERLALEQPDWVMVSDNGYKAYLAPWLLPKYKVVLEVHGTKQFLLEPWRTGLSEKIKLGLVHLLAQRFSSIVLLNEATKVEWKHRKLVVIPNFIEKTATAKPILHTKKIIAVGRVVPEKGYWRMLTIFERFSEKHPGWSLDIYGEIADDEYYLCMIDRGVRGVSFHGEQKPLHLELEQADFLIHTSHHEGFSMAIAEALILGRTVVAFDVPFDVAGLIEDGVTGFLVSDGDLDAFQQRMETLVENPDMIVSMGAHAANSLGAFEKAEVLKSWKRFFES